MPPDPHRKSSYELPLAGDGRPEERVRGRATPYLSESLLLRSAVWFCRLRWIAVVVLLVFGILGLFPTWLPRIGLRAHTEWPFGAAAVLTMANVVFLVNVQRLTRASVSHGAETNLWAQIIVDLLVLTVVVHYMGSLETYVGFAYLFHIVLACIFFPRLWSFLVTAVACVLYVGCVVLEETGVLSVAGIYADATLRDHMDRVPGTSLLNVTWATVTWIVVWYLTSHLSAMVRDRDDELARTNRRLLEAQEAKTQHMLLTTHELKTPFAAVDANVQALLKGYCGPLPREARGVLIRIGIRCRRLAGQIHEMLQLANLQSTDEELLRRVPVDLADVLRWCTAQVRPLAEDRGVVLDETLQPARTVAVNEQMKMLFSNLLSNAIVYSHRGGRVEARCAPVPGDGPTATIEDHGIGIAANKISRIFDAHYRTDEAVWHHQEATGLGLAIVRHVAQTHHIRVRVESEPGVGTKFLLQFPAAEQTAVPAERQEEAEDGLSDDRG